MHYMEENWEKLDNKVSRVLSYTLYHHASYHRLVATPPTCQHCQLLLLSAILTQTLLLMPSTRSVEKTNSDLQTAKLLVDYKASKAPWLMNTKVNLFQRLERGGGAEHNLYCEQIWDKVQALMLHLFVVWSKVRHELC